MQTLRETVPFDGLPKCINCFDSILTYYSKLLYLTLLLRHSDMSQ